MQVGAVSEVDEGLGCLRTGYSSKPGNHRYRMIRTTEHVSTDSRWDSHFRDVDAGDDRFYDTKSIQKG
jgi:hypothetical protein